MKRGEQRHHHVQYHQVWQPCGDESLGNSTVFSFPHLVSRALQRQAQESANTRIVVGHEDRTPWCEGVFRSAHAFCVAIVYEWRCRRNANRHAP